jgi:hypothetical protein
MCRFRSLCSLDLAGFSDRLLVVNDPKNPENNGKVFLFKYGVAIFRKIKDMMNPPPEFPEMTPVDPYDVIKGAHFRLRQIKEDGWPNFDKSSFDAPSSIGDDDLINEIEKQMHDLRII